MDWAGISQFVPNNTNMPDSSNNLLNPQSPHSQWDVLARFDYQPIIMSKQYNVFIKILHKK